MDPGRARPAFTRLPFPTPTPHPPQVREFKYALVWGVSAKHYPQRVGLSHGLADEDVIQARWGPPITTPRLLWPGDAGRKVPHF